jgi:enamine deaminase RidA (YjgF/YER057c/UK114 family)
MTTRFRMSAGAPDPVAPFSHAVEADGWVHVTGQMPAPRSTSRTGKASRRRRTR